MSCNHLTKEREMNKHLQKALNLEGGREYIPAHVPSSSYFISQALSVAILGMFLSIVWDVKALKGKWKYYTMFWKTLLKVRQFLFLFIKMAIPPPHPYVFKHVKVVQNLQSSYFINIL